MIAAAPLRGLPFERAYAQALRFLAPARRQSLYVICNSDFLPRVVGSFKRTKTARMSTHISESFPFTQEEVAAAFIILGADQEAADAEAREMALIWGRDEGWFGYASTGTGGWPLLQAVEKVNPDVSERVARYRTEHDVQ